MKLRRATLLVFSRLPRGLWDLSKRRWYCAWPRRIRLHREMTLFTRCIALISRPDRSVVRRYKKRAIRTVGDARRARTLCGRNAVEVPIGGALESEGISRIVTRFELLGKVERFDYEGSSTLSVHWQDGGVAWSLNLVASKDATRVVVGGTPDPEVARGLIARVLG